MKCEIIDTGKGFAQDNMDFDARLFKNLYCHNQPILHLYQWCCPALTYGYFIRKDRFFKMDFDGKSWDVARRPTGGGIVFHDGDLAFSLLVPANHPRFSRDIFPNYQFVNDCVAHILKYFFDSEIDLITQDKTPDHSLSTHFCMAKITRYDVVLNGKKVGGAAQRMNKNGFLHQGTIFLSGPSERKLYDVFRPEIAEVVIDDFQKNSFFALGTDIRGEILEETRSELSKKLISEFMERL